MDWATVLTVALSAAASAAASVLTMKVDLAWVKRRLGDFETRLNHHIDQHAEGKFQ